MHRVVSVLALGSLVFMMGGCNSSTTQPGRDAGAGDGGPALPDADGDGIPDQYEGRSSNLDTDHDGMPDYLDADSDGDGVPDSAEGGSPGGEPLDTDHDGTPDFQDLDADGNGVPDSVEGADDPDHDHRPNADDTDNDGDTLDDVTEIGPDTTMPVDTDHDGTADYLDTDSDNDTIGDRDEGVADTDHDSTPDRADSDSDNDGLTDAMEAGDADIGTPPVDSDDDHVPDFRDTDSDNDGLSDTSEVMSGTSPTHADSDGDGVSDLVEVVSGTNPDDPADSPRSRGDFVFVEPYMMPQSPMRDTLDFATSIRSADVYFLIDTTGSMSSSIDSVQTSLSTPSTGIIAQIRAMIPDTNFGVGDFKDNDDEYVFQNDTDITPNAAMAQAGVNTLTASGGGDEPEGDVPSLYAVASGMSVSSRPMIPARTGCPARTFGYPCFRTGSVPIIVLVTDAHFHNGRGGTNADNTYTDYETMLPAIVANHIRVIGVAVTSFGSGPPVSLEDLQGIASDSGAVDAGGDPLVSATTGGAVSSAVIDQVRTLSTSTHFDISTRFTDDDTDGVDTWPAFVDHIEANTAGASGHGCNGRPATDSDGDGILDTFHAVPAGERVCFDIIVRQNDTIMPTAVPQLYDATIDVVGDGFTVLDSRQVYFLVPPIIPPAGGPT